MNFIKVNIRQEGIHRWKNCPFDEVAFLREYHRHEFHFEIELEVTHDDREVEIIMCKRKLQLFIADMLEKPTDSSCEMMAQEIGVYFETYYPSRKYKITVLEDGENGGGVTNDRHL